MEFSRQEYWSGLLFPSPGDLPDPGIEPISLASLHWQGESLPLRHWEAQTRCLEMLKGTDKIKTEKSHLSLAKGPGKGETDNIKNF